VGHSHNIKEKSKETRKYALSLSKNYFLALDFEIRNLLTFRDFLVLDTVSDNPVLVSKKAEYLMELIEKVSKIKGIDGTNYSKVLYFIDLFDLEYEKVGRILKDSGYIEMPEEFKELFREKVEK